MRPSPRVEGMSDDATGPGERLWGKQTDLALANFPIAGRPLDARVARALATIKRHAAAVNASLGVGDVDEELATAIADAARRVEAGELDDALPGRRLPDRARARRRT